ncbi:MAG: silent information regulator protein Sir2 [Planctomycetota bacterium]
MITKTFARFIVVLLICISTAGAVENLDRGVVALPMDEGKVYIGWRLLKDDPTDVAFNVYRSAKPTDEYQMISPLPINTSTNFVDKTATAGKTYFYRIAPVIGGKEGPASKPSHVVAAAVKREYVSLKLLGKADFLKCAIADLDGDGAYDYIIKQPGDNIDPHEKNWKRSKGAYQLEAYRSDGTFLWRHDMGWAIEAGTWYSPYVAFDCDGDGRAEVYTKYGEGDPRGPDGRVTTGPEFLARLNGMTGAVEKKTPWLSRNGYFFLFKYNLMSRNLLGIAYLDGKTPSIIMQRGTYHLIKIAAYDADLNRKWYWNSNMEIHLRWFHGQGSHGMIAADVDGDSRDEIVYGAAVLDDNGKGLWSLGKGHPDVCYCGDIDPARPGFEIFYGFETSKWKNGVCLADAKNGKILWGWDKPTKHVHEQGMCADILADRPGLECYAGEKDRSRHWLYDAKGNLISSAPINGLAPRAIRWDADPQQEVILKGDVLAEGMDREKTKVLSKIVGRPVLIADCLGDWREEVITSAKGELRIYSTTIPADSRRPCLMQDRLYRGYVANSSMGYWYPPLLGESSVSDAGGN